MFAATVRYVIDTAMKTAVGEGLVATFSAIDGELEVGAKFQLGGRERTILALDSRKMMVTCLTAQPLDEPPHWSALIAPPATPDVYEDLLLQRVCSADFADALTARFPDARRTGFGDGPALSARLIDLVRRGTKTTTCGALRDYEARGEAIPRAGEVMVVENWEGVPVLAYRLTDVQVVPFDAVPEDFALAEGEGDFADWRAAHEAYFARNGGFDPAMPVVCERFELVAPSDEASR